MPKRKNSRKCATEGCKYTPTLHPHCDKCRKGNCQHTETHYDANFAKVCDNCGTTVKESTKKKGRNMVGKGKKAPWQANGKLTTRAQEEAHCAAEGGMVL